MNHCKYLVPTVTPYLTDYFKIKKHREMFGKSNLDVINHLIAQSHEDDAGEIISAKQGKIKKKTPDQYNPQLLMEHLQSEHHTMPTKEGWEVPR